MSDFTAHELSFMYRSMEYMLDHGIWIGEEAREVKDKIFRVMSASKIAEVGEKVCAKYEDALSKRKTCQHAFIERGGSFVVKHWVCSKCGEGKYE